MPPRRVDGVQRRPDAIGSGRQRRVGENRAAAMGLDRLDDFRIARGHRDRPDARRLGLAQGPHDHRQPADVRQRLSGQTLGGHAGRDDDKGF